jgi:hypothetical protein
LLGDREVGFYNQKPIGYAASLQFCDVPPAGHQPAPALSQQGRRTLNRGLAAARARGRVGGRRPKLNAD